MRPVQPNYRRRSRWTAWLGMGAVALLGLAGLAAVLLLVVPGLFGGDTEPAEEPKEDPFVVRIPVNVRPIAPYTKVREADLRDPKTGWFRYVTLPPDSAVGQTIRGADPTGAMIEGQVAKVTKGEQELVFEIAGGQTIPHGRVWELGGVVIAPSAIVGRVMSKPKNPGLGFRESAFFPKGTPEGLAGATPPGMRGMVMSAEKIVGAYKLRAGDRIDLIANVAADEVATFDRSFSGSSNAPLTLSATSEGRKSKQTEPIMLAQNSVVLLPVHVREEPADPSPNAKPIFEIALAVDARDVIAVQGALSKDLDVTCVAHSMQATTGEAESAANDPNQVAVPVTSRNILAYEIVTLDHFRSPATRKIRYEMVDSAAATGWGVELNVSRILGAVAKHDIPKGSMVRARDLRADPSSPASAIPPGGSVTDAPLSSNSLQFVGTSEQAATAHVAAQLPAPRSGDRTEAAVVGERPSIAKFIPTGRRAVTIPWNRLFGAEHLQIGDRVDLTVSFSLERDTVSAVAPDSLAAINSAAAERRETRRGWAETLGERAEPWFAAVDAIVIGPVGYPPPTAASRFLGEQLYSQNDRTDDRQPTGPPIVVAIDSRDVVAMAAALATKDAVFSALFHSGATTASEPGRREIVILPKAIESGEPLTPDMLLVSYTRRQMVRKVATTDAYYQAALSPSELKAFLGRRLKTPMKQGSFFTADDFHPAGYQPPVIDSPQPGPASQPEALPVIEAVVGERTKTYTFGEQP